MTRRLAFVVPRFGKDIAGGAETLVALLAERLAARGDYIEIWTTCARDNRSWSNHYPMGETLEQGLHVFRFPVSERNLDIWIPRQIQISEGIRLSVEDQLEWMAHSVNSLSLYECISRRAEQMDAVFYAPYLFGTTFWGSLIHPQNAVLIPCLHDEHFAYLDLTASMFRQVRGCLFNAIAEQRLAQSLYGKVQGAEVGMGFDPWPEAEVASLEPWFKEPFPYVLYLGRKETGKNVQVLIDCFIAAKESHLCPDDLKLVIAGAGSFDDILRPAAKTRSDILDIAHLDERDKRRLLKHASFLCQPSKNESFSIVLMEAWLLGTPVVVHAGCAVTKEHVLASGGGFYFTDEVDFAGIARELVSNLELSRKMGKAGEMYVRDRYSWAAVLNRFDATLDLLFPEQQDNKRLKVINSTANV